MGNGLYRINWSGTHFDSSTEVDPMVLRDVTVAASGSEAHAVGHAEAAGERSGPNIRYNTNSHKRQTGKQLKQTKAGQNTTSLAEVIIIVTC